MRAARAFAAHACRVQVRARSRETNAAEPALMKTSRPPRRPGQKLRDTPKNAWPTPSVSSAISGLSLISSGNT